MNNTIRTRLQLFLAKIAGHNVDIDTLTPPVAINLEEDLMLDIADRLDDIEESVPEIPAVTAEDNGKVLAVENGAWTPRVNAFLVECTPTAMDYSGTMNCTVDDIYNAWVVGKEIIFKVVLPDGRMYVPCTSVGFYPDLDYPSFNAESVLIGDDILVCMATGTTNDGTSDTYFTSIYSLTNV